MQRIRRAGIFRRVYYVDDFDYLVVDPYLRTDLRVAWHPTDNVEISVIAQDAFDSAGREHYEPVLGHSSDTEPVVYGRVTWAF